MKVGNRTQSRTTVNGFRSRAAIPAMFLLGTIFLSSGCSVLANFMHSLQGNDVPAAYEGFEEATVAVVVVSDAASYGPDSLSRLIARALGNRMSMKVKDVTVIPQQKIDDWKDKNGWNESDFVKLGEGVGADKVLAVEIGSYSIREGSTLFKGRAMVTTTVYDLTDGGNVVFSQGPAEYQFPRSHGRPAISTDPQAFEAMYLNLLVESIVRNFHTHARAETIAEDAIEF